MNVTKILPATKAYHKRFPQRSVLDNSNYDKVMDRLYHTGSIVYKKKKLKFVTPEI